MDKYERIMRYIHYIAQQRGIDYQDALKLKIVRMYIEYVESDTEILG